MKVRSRCENCGRWGAESLIDRDCPGLWEPFACPGVMKRVEIIEHVGLHSDRLARPEADRERAFAKVWAEENRQNFTLRPPTLASLLGRMPTQDEATVVATVIQWLGSNCGQALLHEASTRAIRSPARVDGGDVEGVRHG